MQMRGMGKPLGVLLLLRSLIVLGAIWMVGSLLKIGWRHWRCGRIVSLCYTACMICGAIGFAVSALAHLEDHWRWPLPFVFGFIGFGLTALVIRRYRPRIEPVGFIPSDREIRDYQESLTEARCTPETQGHGVWQR